MNLKFRYNKIDFFYKYTGNYMENFSQASLLFTFIFSNKNHCIYLFHLQTNKHSHTHTIKQK